MKCLCGFVYSKEILRRLQEDLPSLEAYGIVRNEEWEDVMKLEHDILDAQDEEKLNRIGVASRHVGSIYTCPECGLLMISWPISDRGEDEGPHFFRRVEDTE